VESRAELFATRGEQRRDFLVKTPMGPPGARRTIRAFVRQRGEKRQKGSEARGQGSEEQDAGCWIQHGLAIPNGLPLSSGAKNLGRTLLTTSVI
jgi:hypothetical protein